MASKETLPSYLLSAGRHFCRRRSRTHTTQLERREEEEGEANLFTFGGCEPICFEPEIRGSNVLGFAPNLVSSFYT